jgi:hypothetical protein
VSIFLQFGKRENAVAVVPVLIDEEEPLSLPVALTIFDERRRV